MSEAGFLYHWLFVDVSDDQITRVWVMLDATGDAPYIVQGCHAKAFPARKPLDLILREDLPGAALWPVEPPPFKFGAAPEGRE